MNQKTNRTLSVPVYLLALVITVVIFSLGVYVGTALDDSNLQRIEANVGEITTRISSAESLLLSDDPELFCPVYLDQLDKINTDIELIGNKLTVLEEEKNVIDTELKKQFFILEVNSYLLSKRINKECGKDTMFVLYFYSNKGCEKCRDQGIQLTEARKNLRGISTYSFDGELGSPVVDALKKKYGVSVYPTIVINEGVYAGYKGREELKELLVQVDLNS